MAKARKKRKATKRKAKAKTRPRAKAKRPKARRRPGALESVVQAAEETAALRRRLAGRNTFED